MTAILAASLMSVLAAGAKSGVEIPKDEKAFLERLHAGNQKEVKLGELGKQKGTSPAVREFGEMMIRDHSAADEKVMALAKTKKLTLGAPKPINELEKMGKAAHGAKMAKLQAMEGKAFDCAFMATMVSTHDATLGKMLAAAEQFGDGDVGKLVREMMPKVSEHRDHAYRILGEVKPDITGVGGAGSEGMPVPEYGSPMRREMDH